MSTHFMWCQQDHRRPAVAFSTVKTSPASSAATSSSTQPRGRWLWDRKFYRYPNRYARYRQLALTVFVTIVLYYDLYTIGGVSSLLAAQLHMSFTFLAVMIGVTNFIGAFGSIVAGVGDRFGRVNMVIWGLLVVGVCTAFVVPATSDRYALGAVLSVIGFVEGMLLVATPALVRDFSPQVGRAAAMGIWNIGPVAGSLVVATVAAFTLDHFGNSWTSQFRISGIVGMVTFLIALFNLKELSPELRDQLVVHTKDVALVEARASAGFEADMGKPFAQLLKLDIVGPAIGCSTLLLLYFTLVGFGPVLYATAFHFDASQANTIAAWSWAANLVVTVLIGFLFDWTRLRKPWMVVGGVLTIIFELILLFNLGNALSVTELSILMGLMSGSFGFAFVAFAAAYTETIESHNPALVATGLAIWGWILRIFAFLSFIILPAIMTSATILLLQRNTHSSAYERAVSAVFGEWRTWLWVCVAGSILFILTAPLHRGPWTRQRARQLMKEHDLQVANELTALQGKLGQLLDKDNSVLASRNSNLWQK